MVYTKQLLARHDGFAFTEADAEADGFPLGDFTVNSGTSGSHFGAKVTALADGGMAVVWISYDPDIDDDNGGIALRIFGADGQPVGDDIAVNTIKEGLQREAKVLQLQDGSLVVVWKSPSDETEGDIYAQRFSLEGERLGEEFVVHDDLQGQQVQPVLVALDDGGFMVLWADDLADGSGRGIAGRTFDENGGATSEIFLVNQHTDNSQAVPAATKLEDGSIAVVWQSLDPAVNRDEWGIALRLIDQQGNPVTGESRVNDITETLQVVPTVAPLADGGFVVVWESRVADGVGNFGYADHDVKARVFDASGDAVSDEIAVAQNTENSQARTSVVGLEDGGFVVVWRSFDQEVDGDGAAIAARQFSASGDPVDGEFRVNVAGESDQRYPNSAILADGSIAVAWQNLRGSNGIEISARILVPDQNGEYAYIDRLIAGTEADDTLSGSDNAERLLGETGDDVLSGGNGDDTVEGGDGNDRLDGGLGNDLLKAGDHDDTLRGADGADTLLGGGGNDQLWAGAGDTGDDVMNGGEGKDIIGGGAGNDKLVGGTGADIVFGGSGDDTLIGGASKNSTETAANQLWSGGGNDLIYGGGGRDALGGGDNNDEIHGGGGNDVIYAGKTGADSLYGDGGNDIIFGGSEDDLIEGGDGADELYGGAGDDVVAGDAGSDTLYGGGGNDTLTGGAGDDTLRPGDGLDMLVFAAGDGADQVDGFTMGDDTLDLSATTTDFTDLASVQAAATDTEGGVLIDLGGGDSLLLTGLTVADLADTDFIF
ncbi:calcium-binding protein [Kordiimonas lacus]|nr:calcium-binding protein [Kordiimonas lacus]